MVTFTPIGFLELDAVVSNISFSPDNHKNVTGIETENTTETSKIGINNTTAKFALLTLSSGVLLSITTPLVEQVDTKLTYKIENNLCNLKPWIFEVPLSKKTVAVPVAPVAPLPSNNKTDQKESKQNSENPTAVTDPNSNTENTSGTSSQTPHFSTVNKNRLLFQMRKERGLVIKSESKITSAYYLEGGYFLIGLINTYGEGEIRACKYSQPNMSRY